MALITGFTYRSDRTVSYRTRVDCGWTHDESEGLLQLETYASDGTTSQVLQVDQQRAGELMGIIAQVFPGLYLPHSSRTGQER
ncbi:hypothetical protein BA059_20820 [Mycolicibacterium sp. (ex Dasyatis americana)]|nr:hypothetical protein BA059_20820 [Mycolicibacterium sp. (ex Dasyatis americana)]